MKYSIANVIVLNLIQTTQRLGLPLEKAPIELQKYSVLDPNEQISFEEMVPFYKWIEQQSQDEEFGLHAGELYHMAALGLVGQMLQNCKDIQQALDMACKYIELLTNIIILELKVHQDKAKIIFHIAPYCIQKWPQACKQLLHASMLFAFHELKILTGKNHPLIAFSTPFKIKYPKKFHRILDVTLLDQSALGFIVFDSGILGQKIQYSDYKLLLYMEELACSRLKQLAKHQQTIADRIKTMLYQLLSPKLPPIQTIASNLNMSVRALQRKLQEAGSSYSKICTEVKKELVVGYLKKGMELKEICYLMDYAEPSSFANAFKKWFGQSPHSYRQQYLNQ